MRPASLSAYIDRIYNLSTPPATRLSSMSFCIPSCWRLHCTGSMLVACLIANTASSSSKRPNLKAGNTFWSPSHPHHTYKKNACPFNGDATLVVKCWPFWPLSPTKKKIFTNSDSKHFHCEFVDCTTYSKCHFCSVLQKHHRRTRISSVIRSGLRLGTQIPFCSVREGHAYLRDRRTKPCRPGGTSAAVVPL